MVSAWQERTSVFTHAAHTYTHIIRYLCSASSVCGHTWQSQTPAAGAFLYASHLLCVCVRSLALSVPASLPSSFPRWLQRLAHPSTVVRSRTRTSASWLVGLFALRAGDVVVAVVPWQSHHNVACNYAPDASLLCAACGGCVLWWRAQYAKNTNSIQLIYLCHVSVCRHAQIPLFFVAPCNQSIVDELRISVFQCWASF